MGVKMAKSKQGISFESIDSQRTSTARAERIIKEIARVKVPCLSDALINRSVGGQHVLIALDDAKERGTFDPGTKSYGSEPLKWRIRKILNRDGSKPRKGDTVKVMFERNLKDAAGHTLSGEQWADIIRRGGEPPEKFRTYTLDNDCCFECGYADASYLLTQYGVHYETGIALTSRKPVQGSGNSRVHNFLYEEVVDGVNDNAAALVAEIDQSKKRA